MEISERPFPVDFVAAGFLVQQHEHHHGARIIHLQPNVTLHFKGQDHPNGSLFIATNELFWWSDEKNHGFAFEYKKIIIHAISRDLASFPHECIFCQLDSGDAEEEEEVSDDTMRLVPADKASLEDMYNAICHAQVLHPDTDDEEDDGVFFSHPLGVQFGEQGQATIDRLSQMLGEDGHTAENGNHESEDGPERFEDAPGDV